VWWSVDEGSARTTIPMLAQWATECAVARGTMYRSLSIYASQRRSCAQRPTVPSPPAWRFLSAHTTDRDRYLPLLVLLQRLDVRLLSGQNWVTSARPTLDDAFETSMHLPDVGGDLVCACRDISRRSLVLVLRTRLGARPCAAAHPPPYVQEHLELVDLLGLWHGAIQDQRQVDVDVCCVSRRRWLRHVVDMTSDLLCRNRTVLVASELEAERSRR
jgi:hypothetical protein